ncbi:MAG: ABC transporter permease [Gemmatimonadetes bacterium]|nr:ABC transporter permease [Gemmatimonadota bacterium]
MDDRVVKPSVDREVEEEFDHHVEMMVRDLVDNGWDEDEARAEAGRRVGNVERWKADTRAEGRRRDGDANRRLWWDELRQDLRYGVRQIRRAPTFAAVVILTLGIAIGANTAVFSVVDAVLLQPLPVTEPDRLSMIWTRYLPISGFDIEKFALSGPEALDIADETRTLEAMALFTTGTLTFTGDGAAPERVNVGFASATYSETMGVPPAQGRWFDASEDIADGPEVVVLSHGLWMNRFGGDPETIGQVVLMNGTSTEVIGIMPVGFDLPSDARAWQPLRITRESQGGRGGHGIAAVGRLAPGMSQDDLDAELAVFRDRWAAEYEHNVGHYAWSQGLYDEIVAGAPERLRLLVAAVALVLLVACANVANLLLTRAERRRTEVAVRRTLGAGRSRITRQLATESMVLAALSAVLGTGLAWAGLEALIRIDPTALPRLDEVRLDGTVMGFVVGVTGVTTLLFGIVPAYIAGKRASGTLASAESRSSGGRRRTSLRRLLVGSEVAVSLVVVVLAALVVRSFGALVGTDPRMDPSDVLTFALSLPSATYPEREDLVGGYEEVLDALGSLPGVESVAATTNLPFTGTGQWDFQLDDRPPRQEGEVAWNAGISHISGDYFATLGIPILEGRTFGSEDREDGPLVVIVSESMARRYWPGESVIGRRMGYEMAEDSVPWMTVVGLVPDPVTGSLDREPYPHVYVPHAQGGISTYFLPSTMQIALRTTVEPESVVPSVRSRIADFDADLPLYAVSTMTDVMAASYAGPRVTTNLLGAFGVIALVLAAVGIYGVISYSVAGRTREIGVRVALGAERREITRLVLGEGIRPVAVGVAVGLALAWFATRLVEAMLYQVEPTDPATFVTVPLLLMAVGFAASLLPARRATRIAPTEALREE